MVADKSLLFLIIPVLIASTLVLGLVKSRSDECELVFEYFPACLEFLTGIDQSGPSSECCRNIHELNKLAKHGLGPRLICSCIEGMVRGTQPPLQNSRISQLPDMCRTKLSFPISESMDCDTV